MSFFDWLLAQQHRRDAVGAYAGMAIRQVLYPRSSKLQVLLKYEPERTREGLKRAHREYRAWCRAQPKPVTDTLAVEQTDEGAFMMTQERTPPEIVRSYFDAHYRVVFWPTVGDAKGPREVGWPSKTVTFNDYIEGHRVGLLTGVEVAPGIFLHDVDIDWSAGSLIAQTLLPATGFVFGRASKRISHCFYTTPEPIPSFRYEDIDKSCLIELRGTKVNGEIGLQTMAPPSIWSKGHQHEALAFVRSESPTHLEVALLRQRVCLSAIAMIFAKHFGRNGFGHEPRLAWAGFLLRAGLAPDDLIQMGEAISVYCDNTEIADVRRAVESTAQALLSSAGKKVKGGPALMKLLGAKGRTIVMLVNGWLGRDSDFMRNSDGQIIRDHQENITRAVNMLEVELSYHTFAERTLIADPQHLIQPLDDQALNSLWLRIDRECRFRPSFPFYEKVIREIAHDHSFHPVREYLSALEWDGEPRIDYWLRTYAGVEETVADSAEHRSYLEAVSSIVLIAAVRRVLHPGCKYDEMLVLESEQGMNKSSALRALCPTDEWFSDDLPLNVDAKQIIERTLGKWIIEASDLVGGRKADRDHLKSMLSRQIDGPARMAYAHLPVERPRQFIIIGTTNSAEYLADMTGARRFWPVRIARFDVEALIRDRDQLWAEAVRRESTGESIRLPPELYEEATGHQEIRREVDAWESVIEHRLEGLIPDTQGRRQISASDIWTALDIKVDRRDRGGSKRISEIMQRFGFERQTVRDHDKRVVTGYVSTDKTRLINKPPE